MSRKNKSEIKEKKCRKCGKVIDNGTKHEYVYKTEKEVAGTVWSIPAQEFVTYYRKKNVYVRCDVQYLVQVIPAKTEKPVSLWKPEVIKTKESKLYEW